jgi:hypothetical protein
MLRCNKNTEGMMDLSLTQIGLTIASGVLLVIVLSLIVTNDWQRTAELQSQASSFSNLLADVENSFFEQRQRFQFSQKDYTYSVMMSTEYLRITTKSAWAGELVVTKKLLTTPWLPLPQQNWTTGEDFHTFLNTTYGHQGTQNDALSLESFTELCQEQNNRTAYFALHPVKILVNDPVFVEKVTIFYDQTKRYDFLLLYQRG